MKRFRKTESYKVKQVVFLALFALIIGLVWLAASNLDKLVPIVGAVALLVLIVFLVRQYDFLLALKEFERAVIFRFGRTSRVGGPGWTFVLPLVESFRIVDLRTHTIDIPKQQVITKDNIVLNLDAVIYLFVRPDKQSVINSVIEVRDYEASAESFVQATIRDVAGTMALPDLVSNIGELNLRVQKALEEIASSWGVTVEAVQIQKIEIPKELEEALTRQKSAEQQKLARMQLAEANKIEIDAVREAAEHLNDKSLSYYYIRALEKLGEGQSTKFILPIELTMLADRIAGGFKKASASEEESLEPLFRKYLPVIKKMLAENGKK